MIQAKVIQRYRTYVESMSPTARHRAYQVVHILKGTKPVTCYRRDGTTYRRTYAVSLCGSSFEYRLWPGGPETHRSRLCTKCGVSKKQPTVYSEVTYW